MDDDLGLGVGLQPDQAGDGLVALLATELGIDTDDEVLVGAAEELVRLYDLPDPFCMCGILRHDQDEGMHPLAASLAGIEFELGSDQLVVVDGILEHDLLELILVEILAAEVGAGRDGGLLDEAVLHGVAEAILEDDVVERLRPRAD